MLIRRIPPINRLLRFEALARLRSVMKAVKELSVTPSLVSHRTQQLKTHLSQKVFARGDFRLTGHGDVYLNRVREALQSLARPSSSVAERGKKPKLAATPIFARVLPHEGMLPAGWLSFRLLYCLFNSIVPSAAKFSRRCFTLR